jgi:hypothetical protein
MHAGHSSCFKIINSSQLYDVKNLEMSITHISMFSRGFTRPLARPPFGRPVVVPRGPPATGADASAIRGAPEEEDNPVHSQGG